MWRSASLLRPRLLAAASGGCAVATATFALSETAAPTVPKFAVGADRYDQATYQGRLSSIRELVDPRTLLVSDAELAAAQALLAEFSRTGSLPAGVDDAAMWDAQRVVSAIIHGPTGEKMPAAGRMSAFVLANVPIAAGLLMSTSIPASLFWQWFNQTYNVSVAGVETHAPPPPPPRAGRS